MRVEPTILGEDFLIQKEENSCKQVGWRFLLYKEKLDARYVIASVEENVLWKEGS